MIKQNKQNNKKIKLKLDKDLTINCSVNRIIEFGYEVIREKGNLTVYYITINLLGEGSFFNYNTNITQLKIYLNEKEYDKIYNILIEEIKCQKRK